MTNLSAKQCKCKTLVFHQQFLGDLPLFLYKSIKKKHKLLARGQIFFRNRSFFRSWGLLGSVLAGSSTVLRALDAKSRLLGGHLGCLRASWGAVLGCSGLPQGLLEALDAPRGPSMALLVHPDDQLNWQQCSCKNLAFHRQFWKPYQFMLI